MHNLALLTQSHHAIAAKKNVKRDQIKEVIFDDNARREFLTGFHKRKVAKAEAGKKKALERQKQDRLEVRREQRRQLRERAIENAAEVESAYYALLHPGDDENAKNEEEEEWTGIPDEKEKEEAYDDEEVVATVTVIEDMDPASFTSTPTIRRETPPPHVEPDQTRIIKAPPKVKAKPRKIRYEKKEDRKRERAKQKARRTEKADLARGRRRRG